MSELEGIWWFCASAVIYAGVSVFVWELVVDKVKDSVSGL